MERQIASDVTICPRCDHLKVVVTDSRSMGGRKWRRRRCPACGWRWSTIEIMKDSVDAEVGELRVRVTVMLGQMAAMGNLLDTLRGDLQAVLASLQARDGLDGGAAEESVLGAGSPACGPDQAAEPPQHGPAEQ